MNEAEILKQQAVKCGVAGHLIPGLMRHIVQGIPTGGFLEAFLSNNLMGAISRADEDSIKNFKELATFLYTYAPSGCHGSEDKYLAWQKKMIESVNDS